MKHFQPTEAKGKLLKSINNVIVIRAGLWAVLTCCHEQRSETEGTEVTEVTNNEQASGFWHTSQTTIHMHTATAWRGMDRHPLIRPHDWHHCKDKKRKCYFTGDQASVRFTEWPPPLSLSSWPSLLSQTTHVFWGLIAEGIHIFECFMLWRSELKSFIYYRTRWGKNLQVYKLWSILK